MRVPGGKWSWWALAILPAAPGAGSVDPAAAARDVFQSPDFWWKRLEPTAVRSPSWFQSLIARILELLIRAVAAVWEFILKILRFLFGRLAGESSGGAFLVWIFVAVILGYAAWKLVPMIVGLFGRRPVASGEPAAVGSEILADEADLRGRAAEALSQGHHAEAIRLALLALIAALEKRGLLRYDTTRTNREYRAELRPRPELADRFGRLARIYEGVWYGRQPASLEQAKESVHLCQTPIDAEALAPG